MAFWGVEVKPGNRYTHLYDQTRGRLRITQAVLGNPLGSSAAKSVKPTLRTVVQCNYDKSSPVLVCALTAGSNESSHMELEFEEQNEVVFSVLGQRSVHLTGYFVGGKKFVGGGEDSEDTNGEDIADTESEGLGADEDDSYESDFIDDDDIIDDAPSSPLLQTSEEEEPWKRRAAKRKKRQVIIESEEEEENEFPKDEQKGKDNKRKSDEQKGKDNKRKSDEQKGKDNKRKSDEEQERGVSKSKKVDKKENSVEESKKDKTVESVGENGRSENSTQSQREEKKKKKKKSKISKKETEKDEKKQPKRIETFPNGLIIEEISTGRPDGQIANPGCKVYVNYVGKLQNGTVFDSNAGEKPFKFHLGKGQVITGWDLGINGMRVGDKRRLTIPPTLGYGDKEMEKVPKNSWLDFEVEIVKVK
ncbi:hypothetical protein LUZ60_017633 [Juncus effusus]|nr:hypothetical protein LUZ60_017633 [Juncus effusus]